MWGKKTDMHTRRIKELNGEIKILKQEQQEQAYRFEDQENKERSKNLRIRGLPESPQTENLKDVIGQVFNLTSTNEATNELMIEGAHRTRRSLGLPSETPRDIVVHFDSLEEKSQIWKNLKGKPPIVYEGKEIQIF